MSLLKNITSPSNSINLIYIRAAIENATGQRLPLKQIRDLLVEEGLITPYQARVHAKIFTGYRDYYDSIAQPEDGFEPPDEFLSTTDEALDPYDQAMRTWEESGESPL
jgi:hypothetical protein